MLSVFDNGAPSPCPAPFNLAAHVLARGAALADKPALLVIGPDSVESWSYARLIAAVRGCGHGLLARGLQPGDRILMRLANTPAFPVLFLGSIAAGLVPIPTPAQATGAEITGMARTVAPALIVADEGMALPEPLPCPVLPAAELARAAALPPCDWAMGDPDRLAYIVFTSGTSGQPQAVAHAHRAIWARRMMHQDWYGLTEADRLLHAGAFNWTYTLGTGLMDPWTLGATALIPAQDVGPAQLGAILHQHGVTIFAAAPGVYRQMLRHPLPALPQLRHGLSAGEKLPDASRRAWHAATGTSLHEALGLSECSTFLSGGPHRPAPEGCIGYPQSGRRVAVLDDNGPVPRGMPGVLAIARRDPGLFLGYMNENSLIPPAGDWFRTGDMVSMAEDGAIRYLGRADDQMNPGGFRVSPLEVEAVVATFPGIAECGVTEIEVKPGSTVIGCFYVATQALDPKALADFAASRLARYKCPRLYTRVAALPYGPNHKLLRRALRGLAPKEGI